MSFLADLEARAAAENPALVLPAPRSSGSSPLSAAPVTGDEAMEDASTTVDIADPSAATSTGVTAAPAVAAPVKRRAPSPPRAPPPKTRKIQPTIKLAFKLSTEDGSVPTFDFLEEAEKRKLVVHQEAPASDEESEPGASGDESGDEAAGAEKAVAVASDKEKAPKVKRQRKIEARHEGYDSADSMIDNTELAKDVPQVSIRPSREGFFVCSGVVERYDEAHETKKARGRKPGSKNKPKVDADGNPVAPTRKRADNPAASGTDAEPASKKAKTDAEPKAKKSKRAQSSADGLASPTVEAPKRAKVHSSTAVVDGDADDDVVVAKSAVVGRAALSAAIQPDIDAMVALIALESFEPKHKFPDALKLPLHDLAIKALKTGDFGENLFQAMAAIFPYNLFTMRKFIVKDVYPHRKADIEARKDAAISKFEVQVNEAMPASEAAYVQSTEKYARDREAWDAAQGVVGDENAPPVVPMPPPTSNADVSMDVDGPDTSMADVSTATPAAGKEPVEPKKRFKWPTELRELFYQIIMLDTELLELETEKLEVEKKPDERPSELKARKEIYARLVELWPAGWMNSTILSREFSNLKKKHLD